ncbi:MAG: hypothetical protein ACRDA7_00415 [Metamycoplasmataceae bacterium]
MNNKFGINQNHINRISSISEERLANKNNFQPSVVNASHNVNFNPFNTTQFNVPNPHSNYNPQQQTQQIPMQQFQPQQVVVPQPYQQTQQIPMQHYTQQVPMQTQQQPQIIQNQQQTPFVTKTIQISTQQMPVQQQPQIQTQTQQLQFVPLQQNLIPQFSQDIQNTKFIPQQQMLYSEVEQDFPDEKMETAKVEIKLKKLEKLFKLRYITAEEYLRKKREIIKKTIEEIA